MAEEHEGRPDAGQDAGGTPSLEPPSLGFGFGRKRRRRDREAPPEAPSTEPPAADEETSTSSEETATAPAATAAPEPLNDEPEPTESAEAATEHLPPATAAPEPEPEVAPEPLPEPSAPPLFVDEVDPAARTSYAATGDEPREPNAAEGATVVDVAKRSRKTRPPRQRKERRAASTRQPLVTGLPAALLTGAVVGLVVVVLTWASLRLCEWVTGTPSCGDPGFFLLLAILVVAVLVGGALLRAFRVPDPMSTSFLAVGLMTVIALLFLIDALFEWWMAIAIPLAAMATYALSHWVTTALVDSSDR